MEAKLLLGPLTGAVLVLANPEESSSLSGQDDSGTGGHDSEAADAATGGNSGSVGSPDTPSASCTELKLCGPDGKEDCCARVNIPGGVFSMGVGEDADACPAGLSCGEHEGPEHDVEVGPFVMDKFEVTVGRFRGFVKRSEELELQPDEGSHPLISGSGWQAGFDVLLPTGQELKSSLACDDQATWTDEPGIHEALPINCVNWATAFAFCIEAGGRLPTEAEWEFAAAGGEENRLYPWGNDAPDDARSNFFPAELGVAGSLEAGKGRYENADLAGNVWEWALDWLDTGWYSDQGADCVDCARVAGGTHRVLRGGAFNYEAVALRAATRSGELPETRDASIGFRCVYAAK